MIDAFKSTLEELTFSDVILLVIDANDSIIELKKKFQSCNKTLNEIGVDSDNIIFVFNKTDLTNYLEILKKVQLLNLENKEWVSVSAKTGEKMENLKQHIGELIHHRNPTSPLHEDFKEELGRLHGN